MLEALLELFGELFAEILVNLLLEVGISRSVRFAGNNWWTVCMIVVGGALGWASTAVWGRPLLPWTGARVVTIIVVPVAVAFVMAKLAERRRQRGGRPGLLDNWTDAYFFSLAFSIVRFAATF